jgi:hypothetical protein
VIPAPVSASFPKLEKGPELVQRLPRQPFLVGRQVRGTSTIWFLRPTSPPVPGPWDVAMLVRGV